MTSLRLDLATTPIAAGLIPAGSTTFHILLAVHITAGLTCVITGAVAALSPKRPGRHPWFGTTYYWSLAVVFATATVLARSSISPRSSPGRPPAAQP